MRKLQCAILCAQEKDIKLDIVSKYLVYPKIFLNRTVVYLVHLVLCCVQPNSCVCDCISVLYAEIPIHLLQKQFCDAPGYRVKRCLHSNSFSTALQDVSYQCR